MDAEGRRTFRVHDGNGNVLAPMHLSRRATRSGVVLYYEVFLQGHEYDELNLEIARINLRQSVAATIRYARQQNHCY